MHKNDISHFKIAFSHKITPRKWFPKKLLKKTCLKIEKRIEICIFFECFHTSRVEPGNGQPKVGSDRCGKSLQSTDESGGSNPNKTRILSLGTKEVEEFSMLKNFHATFFLSNMM